MIKVLTSAGINPRRRSTSLGPYVLKLHPLSDTKESSLSHIFHSSRLRGRSAAMLIVNISTSLAAGARWDVADDGMYCSNDVPVQPSYLHSAYCFNQNQLVRTWGGDTAEGPPRPPPLARPQWSHQHQHSPTDDVLDSQADYRLQAHTQAPIPPLPSPLMKKCPWKMLAKMILSNTPSHKLIALHLHSPLTLPLSRTLPSQPFLSHIHGPALSST